MPSFVALAHSFPKSEDPIEKHVCPPEGCTLRPTAPRPPLDFKSRQGASVLDCFRFSLHSRGLQRLTKIFARVGREPRCTCLVARIDPGPAPLSFRRSGASNGAAPVPTRPLVWAPEAEMLGQTDKQTNKQTHKHFWPTFFSPPSQE